MAIRAALKSLFISSVPSVRTVRFGIFQGLRFPLDLQNQLQVYLGLWERETYHFTKISVQQARWAIDVGAARGEFTLYLLGQQQVESVIAVEPWDFVGKMLHHNLALNGCSMDPRLKILSQKVGTSPLADHTTLDAVAVDRMHPGFIKIDVDGPEADVLRSGEKLLKEASVSLLVETHSVELENTCLKLLTEWGYECHIIKNAWWRMFLPEVRPVGQNRWIGAVKRQKAPARPL